MRDLINDGEPISFGPLGEVGVQRGDFLQVLFGELAGLLRHRVLQLKIEQMTPVRR